MKHRAVCISCALALGTLATVASAREGSRELLGDALEKATRANKRVLVFLRGGDDSACNALEAALKGREVAELLLYEYELVARPAGSEAGKALLERLHLQERPLPLLAVLDTEARVLGSSFASEEGETVMTNGVRAFLQEHICAPQHARKVLAAGLASAEESQRHAFVYLSAPWCGWCHRLGDFLGHPDVRDRFAKDYVVVKIDQERMTEGADVASELRKDGGGGIPWMVILDGEGRPKITSDGPKGNVGCPAQPHEIDHFLAMVDATRRHMSEEDRAILERELREYGAELVTSKRDVPGWQSFTDAASRVKYGRFEDAIELIGEAFEAGYAPEEILTSTALRPLREDPERRLELSKLFEEHVRASHLRMVDALETGQRIRLEGRIVDMQTGQPIPGALMQLFHTDAGGEYRPGMDSGGGAGNPRLFGFLRTDDEGRFVVDTIMPERYPNSTVPRHVHYRVRAKGYPELVSECFFDCDPNLDERTRKSAPERNFPVVKLERDEAHRLAGELIVRVP